LKDKVGNDKGMALVVVLVLMAVVLILGTTVLSVSLSETKSSVYQQKQIQAQSLARSGVDIAAEYVIAHPDAVPLSIPMTAIGSGHFEATLQKNADTVMIRSVGTYDGVQDVVAVKMELVDYMSTFTGVKQTGSHSELNLGALGITTSVPLLVEANVPHVSDITFGNSQNMTNITAAVNNTPLPSVKLPSTIGFATLSGNTISQNTNDVFVDIKNKETLVFDTGGNDLIVVLNSVNIKGSIEVIGGGNVHLYLKSPSLFQTPHVVTANGKSNLFIYLMAGADLDIRAHCDLSAYIYGPDAQVLVQAHSNIVGSIVAETITKNGVNGPAGSFAYKPLTENPDYSGILSYQKGVYSN
jgi:Tfp pilus assembly protein PilX